MRHAALVLLCLLALALPTLAHAQPAQPPHPRDSVQEQEINGRLAVANPAAVPLFQAATRALDAQNFTAARDGFAQVLKLVPGFPDALRRLSYVDMHLNQPDAAVRHARAALAAHDEAYNHMALAAALVGTKRDSDATEALAHATIAAQALPNDDSVNLALLQAGAAAHDDASMRRASTALVRVAPDEPYGHFFMGVFAAEDRQWEQAEQELLTAQRLGMPADAVQRVLNEGVASEARWQRLLRWGRTALLGWLGSLAALFGLGLLLSRATVVAIRGPRGAHVRIGTVERGVRAIYRLVILLVSLQFYISIPFLIVIVLALGGGILYLFVALGRVPVQLLVIVGLTVFYTLVATVRSLFVRVQEEQPGRPLTRAEAPALWDLVEAVAQRVGTRPVDAIYITPAPEIAVSERGGTLTKLRGAGQRCLILGLGTLPGMTQDQLKAILAHEYGHFSHRDTAGGTFALQVRRSMFLMAHGLAQAGQAHKFNPVWLFLTGYSQIYGRITLGASRLQEILADRYAAAAYGAENFVDGLMHVVRQSLLFELQVSRELELAQGLRRGLANLYTLPDLPTDSLRDELEQRLREVLSRPTSVDDSHPAVQERIALVRQIQAAYDAPPNAEPVGVLLPQLEALQHEMTARVQARV